MYQNSVKQGFWFLLQGRRDTQPGSPSEGRYKTQITCIKQLFGTLKKKRISGKLGKGRVRSTTQPVVSLPSSFVLSYMHGPGLSVARNHKGVNRESSRTRPLPPSWKAKMESPRSHSAGSWVQEMPKTLKEENRPLKLEEPWAQERETNPHCSFLSPLHQLV